MKCRRDKHLRNMLEVVKGAYQQAKRAGGLVQSIREWLDSVSLDKIPFLMKCSHCATGLEAGL